MPTNSFNPSIKFVPDYGPGAEEDPSAGKSSEAFEFAEFGARKSSDASLRFSYDSETARNFDKINVKKAREGVKEIVRDALNKAKAQAGIIKETARTEGFNAGYKEGFLKGEEFAKGEFSPFLETLLGVIDNLSGFRKNLFAKVEREMLEMTVDLAKKIIHHELSTREDSVQDIIHLAIQSVLDRENLTLRINPAEKIYAETYRPEIQQYFGDVKNLVIQPDPSIARGGCVVETNFGTIDARLERLNEQIDGILNLAPPAPEPEPEAEKPPPVAPPSSEEF